MNDNLRPKAENGYAFLWVDGIIVLEDGRPNHKPALASRADEWNSREEIDKERSSKEVPYVLHEGKPELFTEK